MSGEFSTSMHTGSGPADLRTLDPRIKPRVVDGSYRDVLIARGEDEIARMLFDPIGVVDELALIREVMPS